MASDRQACLAAGMNEHVGKPFDMGHLVTVLLRMVGRDAAVADGPQPVVLPIPVPDARAGDVAHDPLRACSSSYLDVAAAVERLSGLTSLYVDVLQDFITSLDAVEGEFRQAAAQGQMALLLAQMHSLKGTAATLGAMPLSEHAARLEARFRKPPQGLVVQDALPALLALVQATQTAGVQALQSLRAAEVPAPTRYAASDALPDRAAARTLLLELSSLLRASNLAVLEHFAQQRTALGALSPDAVEKLHQALQVLDLDLALQLCQTHIAALTTQ
jgi:HPt (histidine-containing phosphotransfer) domain-containing protein